MTQLEKAKTQVVEQEISLQNAQNKIGRFEGRKRSQGGAKSYRNLSRNASGSKYDEYRSMGTPRLGPGYGVTGNLHKRNNSHYRYSEQDSYDSQDEDIN